MKYGFIGCGNMGGAIASALAKSTTEIYITDRSGKAKDLAATLGCQYTDIFTIANECDRIFLAVKPQMMADVLAPVQQILQLRKPLLITMAAGLTIEKIQTLAGGVAPVVRIMPNTPVAVGKGMIPYCCNKFVQPDELADYSMICSMWDEWIPLRKNSSMLPLPYPAQDLHICMCSLKLWQTVPLLAVCQERKHWSMLQ